MFDYSRSFCYGFYAVGYVNVGLTFASLNRGMNTLPRLFLDEFPLASESSLFRISTYPITVSLYTPGTTDLIGQPDVPVGSNPVWHHTAWHITKNNKHERSFILLTFNGLYAKYKYALCLKKSRVWNNFDLVTTRQHE